jgi:hypothetical protein
MIEVHRYSLYSMRMIISNSYSSKNTCWLHTETLLNKQPIHKRQFILLLIESQSTNPSVRP